MTTNNKTVCAKDMCSGCFACLNVCCHEAIQLNDSKKAFNATIDSKKCINCNLCKKVCPTNNEPELYSPIYCKQGWAEEHIRKDSSSGGAASTIIRNFIASGGHVVSCLFENGEFSFVVTNDLEKAKKFAGSKYVKSNPGTIYQEIKQLLKQGERVLFVGLPCQSAAAQSICGKNQNLYTVDLICHGTPSLKILKQFIAERGIDWDNITNIKFRENDYFGLEQNGKRFVPRKVVDSYLRLFLHSVDYTENCYSCRYATLNRVSDITLGDAWGQLSDKVPGGVSLILCQTKKGIELIDSTGMHLEDVDLDLAVKANHQLEYPSKKHPGRSKFFKELDKGHSIRRATLVILPKESIKQSIKTGLIKFHLLKDFPPVGNT